MLALFRLAAPPAPSPKQNDKKRRGHQRALFAPLLLSSTLKRQRACHIDRAAQASYLKLPSQRSQPGPIGLSTTTKWCSMPKMRRSQATRALAPPPLQPFFYSSFIFRVQGIAAPQTSLAVGGQKESRERKLRGQKKQNRRRKQKKKREPLEQKK